MSEEILGEEVLDNAPAWVSDAIFYEIFPERFSNGDPSNDPPEVTPWGSTPTSDNFFGGDLQGIIDRLQYLEELGITALYLTPIFRARANHKYDTCDYLSVDPMFGTTELLRSLVAAAHERGIRVILDAVLNHCGDGFWAFEDVKEKGASSKYADWFFATSYPISPNPPNYKTFFGAGSLPKLNTSNPEVQDYLLKVARYWIEECDIDGWRLDAPWKLPVDFLRMFRDKVKCAKPEAYIVGEAWRDSRPWLRRDICDGVMTYTLRRNILSYCVQDGMDAEDFEYEIRCLRESQEAMAPYQLNLLGSHDTPRLLEICNRDVDRAILALTFIFTYIGAPMIYYGDEVGMMGGEDPDCRRCMPWEETAREPKLHQACRLLVHARHEHRALRSVGFRSLWTFNGIFAYLRHSKEDLVIVILNPRESRQHVEVPLQGVSARSKTWRELFTGKIYRETEGLLRIDDLLPKKSLVLFPEGNTITKEY